MISGAHVIIYSDDADADRAFFRDVLQFPAVDAGRGWLIFALPPAELAMHPAEGNASHELFLMCPDLKAVLSALEANHIRFEGPTEARELSSEVVDERERRRTLLGKLSSQTPRPRCHPGERYATYVEGYHYEVGSSGG